MLDFSVMCLFGLYIRKLVRLERSSSAGFPLRLENLEKGEGTFQSGKSQGILNRLEKSGKITQNTGKTSGNFRKMLCYFLVIFKNELCIIC